MNEEVTVTATVATIPVGTIISYVLAVANLPPGWLLCDGSTFNQAIYPELYRARGNKNTLPDMRGYFLRGLDPAGQVDPDGPGRAPQSAQADALKQHGHQFPRTAWGDGELQGGGEYVTPTDQNLDVDNFFTDKETSPFGGAETRPKNIAVNYLILAGIPAQQNHSR